MKTMDNHTLAPFDAPGIEPLRVHQTHSASTVQPYNNAIALTAKENEQK
jgi:hypothetical protein